MVWHLFHTSIFTNILRSSCAINLKWTEHQLPNLGCVRLRNWTLITGISSKDGATPLTASTKIGLSWQKFRRYFLETDVLNKTLYIDIFTSSCLQINIDMLTLMNGQSLSQSEFVGKIFWTTSSQYSIQYNRFHSNIIYHNFI